MTTLSSAAPESTTAALAAAVPKEDEKSKSQESVPGAFPLTPPAETPSKEPQAFSVNPIPATEGPGNPVKLEPGEKVPDPSTLTNNTIQSTVKHDKDSGEEEKVSVAPIPATAGAGNPVHLEPGEKVPDPSTLTSNTITSTATTDAAAYEKSDAQPPQLGPVVTPEAEREANGGMFGLPPLAGSIIPESSLPKDASAKTEQDPGVTIQSAAPVSTTAALAGAVPKEPRVPETVSESQKEAGIIPEASTNAEALEEKKQVEEELKEKVPEQPPAAESSAVKQTGETVAAGAAGAAATFAAATYAAKDKAAETVGLNGQATAAKDVPEVVAESQKEAHVSPEAAANPEAVEEKKAVEAELLAEVKKAGGDATAANTVPEVVAESQKEAHVSPEASANPEAVEEKKEVESELLKEVKKVTEAGEPAPTVTAATSETAPGLSEDALYDTKPLKSSSEPDALNAPASKPAQPETAQAAPTEPADDSRDVSPMSKQPTTTQQPQPTVTTGPQTNTTETKTEPETPKKENAAPTSSKATPESIASGTTDKKKKRRSFFGKLKEKFSSK